MRKAQVSSEAGESSIGIEIDSVQFCASVRLDFDFDIRGNMWRKRLRIPMSLRD
jgi:hypothetical protein